MDQKYKSFIWLAILSIILGACGPAEDTVTQTSMVTPCLPEGNVYKNPVSSDIKAIYEMGVKSAGNSVEYENVQLQALNQLVNHVYYLSDSVEVPLGEKTARITITFVSPELVHLLTVSHYLSNRFLDFSGRLDEQVQAHIEKIIKRNEYIFFITFTATVYTADQTSTFDFPIEKLELINTSDERFIPAHPERSLKKSIDLTGGPTYGFFYYPMAIVQHGACQPVLDENYDNKVELNITNFVINDEEMGSRSWNYKLASLIDTSDLSGTHQKKFELRTLSNQFSPEASILPAMNIENQDFWTALTRIIWLEIALNQ